jgi:16S rRNA (adenine1518-N6/adenine1519-N6)-dimethyltransferase
MKAKKSLGQHFLRSEKALASIVKAGNLTSQDIVLEIGPGQGVLTEQLLAYGLQLIAVEKDDELYKFLQNKFGKEISSGKLVLVHGDILDFEPSSYNLAARSYKLIANIPYNITGAIIEKFLSNVHQPQMMVLLVQREVAQRIVSHNNKESILSISVKAYSTPRYVELVKAGSFVPAPKVDSAIIAIEGISRAFFTDFGEREFFKLLKAGFGTKRKKLSSNLANIFPKEKVQNCWLELGLDPNLRAEDVDIHLWQQIGRKLL